MKTLLHLKNLCCSIKMFPSEFKAPMTPITMPTSPTLMAKAAFLLITWNGYCNKGVTKQKKQPPITSLRRGCLIVTAVIYLLNPGILKLIWLALRTKRNRRTKTCSVAFLCNWIRMEPIFEVRTTYRINEPFLVGTTYKSTTERRTLRLQTLVCICIYLLTNTHICDFAIN